MDIQAVCGCFTASDEEVGHTIGGAGFEAAPTQGVDESPRRLGRVDSVDVSQFLVVMPYFGGERDELAQVGPVADALSAWSTGGILLGRA
jgi:hypothetical protein